MEIGGEGPVQQRTPPVIGAKIINMLIVGP